MQLIKISQDRQQLTDDLFDMFKEHLRILHDVEDNTIRLYLEAAIDGIGIFDVFQIGLGKSAFVVEGLIIVFDREDRYQHEKTDPDHPQRNDADERFGLFRKRDMFQVLVESMIKIHSDPLKGSTGWNVPS